MTKTTDAHAHVVHSHWRWGKGPSEHSKILAKNDLGVHHRMQLPLHLGKLLLKFRQFVRDLPDLLLRQSTSFGAIFHLLFQILDSLFGILGAQFHIQLHIDLITSTIIYLLLPFFTSVLFSSIILRLSLDAEVATLHNPLSVATLSQNSLL